MRQPFSKPPIYIKFLKLRNVFIEGKFKLNWYLMSYFRRVAAFVMCKICIKIYFLLF